MTAEMEGVDVAGQGNWTALPSMLPESPQFQVRTVVEAADITKSCSKVMRSAKRGGRYVVSMRWD
jgi:hypothetical protein